MLEVGVQFCYVTCKDLDQIVTLPGKNGHTVFFGFITT